MSEVTKILDAIEQGDPSAADELLPLVYEELRKLAIARMANEKPGQTLQATALVHEAYLRLVDVENAQRWNGRGHFFAAAAEAMRRILIERARRNRQVRRGGGRNRLDLDDADGLVAANGSDLLDLNDALDRLEVHDSQTALLVKLRFFAGFTMQEAADSLGFSLRTAERNWTYARTWLHRKMADEGSAMDDA